MVQVLPPVAVSEAVPSLLVRLTEIGYARSERTVECPLCQQRYLLLLDNVVCPSGSERMHNLEQLALEYFREMVKREHGIGHTRQQMMMPV